MSTKFKTSCGYFPGINQIAVLRFLAEKGDLIDHRRVLDTLETRGYNRSAINKAIYTVYCNSWTSGWSGSIRIRDEGRRVLNEWDQHHSPVKASEPVLVKLSTDPLQGKYVLDATVGDLLFAYLEGITSELSNEDLHEKFVEVFKSSKVA